MSTKKNSTTRRASAKDKTLRQRAQAIIADIKGYETDTRASIAGALESNDPDLASLVAHAEAGDTVWDLTNMARGYEKIARYVIQFINSSAPDFITDAVMDAILSAGEQFEFETPFQHEDETEGESAKILSEMFAGLHPTYSQRGKQPDPNSREVLAQHIAGVMAHPLTPFRLYHDIGDYISDEGSELWNELECDPEFIKRILDKKTCGYILCPGKGCKGQCTRRTGGAK
jgi:hypothetical protein